MPVGHGSDTSYLLMLRAVASFCPACLTTKTKTRTFIIFQDLRLLRSHLSPQSPPKLLTENEELLEQPTSTFDSWYRFKKIPSLDQNCSTAKMFVGNICRKQHHSQNFCWAVWVSPDLFLHEMGVSSSQGPDDTFMAQFELKKIDEISSPHKRSPYPI